MLKRTLPDERISHAVESAGRAAEIASRAAEELKVENISPIILLTQNGTQPFGTLAPESKFHLTNHGLRERKSNGIKK